ncbi:MAG: cellulose biosynthesis protein BcsN [Pseudomonadota bacterium]
MVAFAKMTSVLLMATAIAGCSTSDGTQGFGAQGEYIVDYDVERSMPIDQAFVKLPAAFTSILAVNERIYRNGLRQRIIHEGNNAVRGENFVEVRLVGKNVIHSVDEKIETLDLREQSLLKEYRKHFPGHKFRVDLKAKSNRYGGYGSAYVKKHSNIGCIFAWQVLEPKSNLGKPTGVIAMLKSGRREASNGVLSYLVRHCAPGMNQQIGHAFMQAIRIHVQPGALNERRQTIWQSPVANFPDEGYVDPFAQSIQYGGYSRTVDDSEYAVIGEDYGTIVGGPATVPKVTTRPQVNTQPVELPKPKVKKPAPTIVAPVPTPNKVVKKTVKEVTKKANTTVQHSAVIQVNGKEFPAVPLPD